MPRRLHKIIVITTVGFVAAAAIEIPNQYYPESLLPVRHMYNIVNAGVYMTVIYKLSSKSPKDKHLLASKKLMEALRRNGGLYIKLGQLIASLDVIVPDEYRATMLALTRDCEMNSF
jgi:predicted unusual protein kinase regulating ubiquinone biosynthesis (AarF/ABC1/UbiB family)